MLMKNGPNILLFSNDLAIRQGFQDKEQKQMTWPPVFAHCLLISFVQNLSWVIVV